jgi:hypothetical protein
MKLLFSLALAIVAGTVLMMVGVPRTLAIIAGILSLIALQRIFR